MDKFELNHTYFLEKKGTGKINCPFDGCNYFFTIEEIETAVNVDTFIKYDYIIETEKARQKVRS